MRASCRAHWPIEGHQRDGARAIAAGTEQQQFNYTDAGNKMTMMIMISEAKEDRPLLRGQLHNKKGLSP